MADQSDTPIQPDETKSLSEKYARHRSKETKPHRSRQPTDPAVQARQAECLADAHITRAINRKKHRNNIVAQWLAIKAAEPMINMVEGAKRINIPYSTLKTYVRQAADDGSLKFEDALERIEHEIIPKVVDNLKEFLDKKDRTVTIETAKGTVFKQFQAQQGIQEGGSMVLALKIETTNNEEPRTIAGVIVGTPKIVAES